MPHEPSLSQIKNGGIASHTGSQRSQSFLQAQHFSGPESAGGYRVFQCATERGALLRPLGDTMYLFPPLNTSRADITAMISVLADALDHVMG